MSVPLRPMRWWDVEPVSAMEAKLFPDAWSPELFWSELAQGTARTYLVATDCDAIVGYAGLAAYLEEAFVQTLAVASDQQGRGVGTALLMALMEDARRRALGTVGLEVRVGNAAAQRLYSRFGFAPVGLRRGYYQPSGDDALVMLATDVDTDEYAERLAALAAGVYQ